MAQLQTLLDIPYGTANGRLLSLDALRPERDSGAALPVVLWLHGGGWYSGNKRFALNVHMLDFLVHSGFVLASVEYRLSNEAAFPTQIHDVKAAIRWLRAKPEVLGIDPERVALAGFSAGGHLAALTATTVGVPELEGESGSPGYSTRVQAAIAMAAPTDFTQTAAASDPSLNPNSTGGMTPEQRLLGRGIEVAFIRVEGGNHGSSVNGVVPRGASTQREAVGCNHLFGSTPSIRITLPRQSTNRLVDFHSINAMHPMQIEAWLALEMLLQER